MHVSQQYMCDNIKCVYMHYHVWVCTVQYSTQYTYPVVYTQYTTVLYRGRVYTHRHADYTDT